MPSLLPQVTRSSISAAVFALLLGVCMVSASFAPCPLMEMRSPCNPHCSGSDEKAACPYALANTKLSAAKVSMDAKAADDATATSAIPVPAAEVRMVSAVYANAVDRNVPLHLKNRVLLI
jgi:hypothetical protein